jgi:hypothetical protein
MKLDTHWLIKDIGHKPSEKSVVLEVSDIVDLATKMEEQDVIYTYHTDKPLDRIALYGTNSDEIVLSIQGCGGGFDKSYHISEVASVLNNFEEVQLKCEEYGFKPDWE